MVFKLGRGLSVWDTPLHHPGALEKTEKRLVDLKSF